MPPRTRPMPGPAAPMPRTDWLSRSGILKPGPGPGRSRNQHPRGSGPSAALRELVLERDGRACVCCGLSVVGQVYSLQHRQRRSQGGRNVASNLITMLGDGTRGCHARVDSRIDLEDEAKGFTVRSWDDPALVPVMVFEADGSGALVYLLDDGSVSATPPLGGAA